MPMSEARLASLEKDVQQLKVDTALVAQSMEGLGAKFDAGMLHLGGALKDQFEAAREDRREERLQALLDSRLDREDALVRDKRTREGKRFLATKVFALVGTALTLAGGAGGVAYYNASSGEGVVPVDHPHEQADPKPTLEP